MFEVFLKNPREVSNSPQLQSAVDEIYQTYNDTVSVIEKKKSLLKFGRNTRVGTTPATVMTLPDGTQDETYVEDNLITTVSSESDADTQDIKIEGHTIDTSTNALSFVVQDATLSGTSQISLDTALARATRLYNNSFFGATTSGFTGTVYVYEDDTTTGGVPDTDAGVHLMVRSGKNQSEKASTSISNADYWIVTNFYADVLEKQSSFVDVELQVRRIDSDGSRVFRQVASISANNGNRGFFNFDPYFVVRKNSDVRIVATADNASTDVSGTIQGYLASIV